MKPSANQAIPDDTSKYPQDQSDLVRLRKAVEASGEVIFLTDEQGIITYVNREFTRFYGHSAEEVIGKTTPRVLKSGLMTTQEYARFWDTLLRKQVVKGEFVNRCKDGTLVTVEGSANPILDEEGNIIGFIAIQRDITERKRVKQALEEAHAFQQSIIDGVADPILVIGANYQVQLMNRAARDFAPSDRVLTQPLTCYQVSHGRETPCEGTAHPCALIQVRETSQIVALEHEHRAASGEARCVEVEASPLWGADGTFQGIIEVMRDITERKLAEDKLKRYTERLRALAVQLAEVAEAERKRLAQELHDQIGQNLTALGINLNIIRSQIPKEMTGSVHFHLDDSVTLIEQTTERIRDVMANLRPPVLDDYGFVAALRWFGEQFARRTDIAVSVDGEEPSPRLAARVENALFRIAQEALTNVAKHAQASRVTACVDLDSETLRVAITDNGIGFDSTQPLEYGEGKGWGLLSMTERAEAVGGRLVVESAPGQGTRVIVEVDR